MKIYENAMSILEIAFLTKFLYIKATRRNVFIHPFESSNGELQP